MKKNRSARKAIASCALLICLVFCCGMSPRTLPHGELSLLSSFSTDFSSSSEGRKENIVLAAKSLNNVVLLPNDELSFNKTVGERSEKRGYKKAKVIEKSRFIDGFGGGVCQVSTALYVAALEADLKITEAHPHSVPSSYVPPSLDATVAYDYLDLKILNDTNGVVVIKTNAKNGVLTVNIFSTEKQPHKIILRSETLEKIAPQDELVLEKAPFDVTPTFDENGIFELLPARYGIKSTLFADYYENGELVKTTIIRRDYYKEQRRIIIRSQ